MDLMIGSRELVTVSAAEFQKNFGQYRERAQSEAVTVTSYGRDSVVLVSAKEYERLKSRDRQALYAWELSHEEVENIARTEAPPETAQYDHELDS